MDFSKQSEHPVSALLERLRVPPLDLNRLSFAGATPLEINLYQHRLPVGNPTALCKLLYAAMKEISRLRMDPRSKLSVLDAFQPMVTDCVTSLAKDESLNSSTFERLSLAQALLKHLLMAYKSAAVELCKDSARPADENTLLAIASALHGAMTTITRLLLNCWQWYIGPPERIWFELHTLYRLALSFGVDRHAFTEREHGRETRATITVTYLKPLLLACITPWRYTGQEIKAIFSFLDRSAQLAELAAFDQSGLFVVNPNSDMGPVYAARIRTITHDHWRLQTQGLLGAVENRSDFEGGPTLSVAAMPDRLMRDLRSYWGREIVRTDNHLPADSPVVIRVGFAAVHAELTGDGNLADFLAGAGVELASVKSQKSEFVAVDTGEATDRWRDAFDAAPVEDPGARDKSIGFPAAIAPTQEAERERSYTAFHVNTSARGACFDIPDAPRQLSAGELISFGEPDEARRSQGIVRWIQVTPAFHRIFGVERLRGSALACAACIVGGSQPLSAFFAGLALPDGGSNEPLEVLLPSLPFRLHQHIRLICPALSDGSQTFLLVDLVDSTFHLSRFKLLGNR